MTDHPDDSPTSPDTAPRAAFRPEVDVPLDEHGEPVHDPVRLIVRPCAGCGQRDDHPRHVIAGRLPWHLDCHALAGCESCAEQLAKCATSPAPDGVIGRLLQNRLRALETTVQAVDDPPGTDLVADAARARQQGRRPAQPPPEPAPAPEHEER